jgi:hypothetical protein
MNGRVEGSWELVAGLHEYCVPKHSRKAGFKHRILISFIGSLSSYCLFLYTNPIAFELPLPLTQGQLSLARSRVMAGSWGARQTVENLPRPQNCPLRHASLSKGINSLQFSLPQARNLTLSPSQFCDSKVMRCGN